MPAELAAVSRLLDDAAFFAPYRAYFSPTQGRPSIPIETYLRLMFLKFRYHLSYEVLCAEVADSVSWCRFARIPFGTPVPHPTTLMKITTRCGEATIAQLNETLLAKAADAKVLKLDKVRADTTVVEANVTYPTDSGLLAKAVGRIARLVERIHGAGGARRTKVRDRRRAAGRRARDIAANLKLRNDDAKEAVRRINAELATLAETAAADAADIVRNARRKLAKGGKGATAQLRALVAELEATLVLTSVVVAQTRSRLGGVMPDGATRVVSLHDPDARPIAKGRLGKPVEFGYKAQVVDNADGIVVDHTVMLGNPPDAPARPRHRPHQGPLRQGAQAGDRGPGLRGGGRGGRRTGCEGRISHLKHGYAWDRRLVDGLGGAQTCDALTRPRADRHARARTNEPRTERQAQDEGGASDIGDIRALQHATRAGPRTFSGRSSQIQGEDIDSKGEDIDHPSPTYSFLSDCNSVLSSAVRFDRLAMPPSLRRACGCWTPTQASSRPARIRARAPLAPSDRWWCPRAPWRDHARPVGVPHRHEGGHRPLILTAAHKGASGRRSPFSDAAPPESSRGDGRGSDTR